MKILVIGAKGQLGSELCEYLRKNEAYTIISHDSDTLDITSLSSSTEMIESIQPNIIVNCAAYTNVDGAEADFETAYKVNVLGCTHLAVIAQNIGCKLIHISTDFVFDGTKSAPYFEYDATTPLGVYGQTKLAGEWEIRNHMSRYFIIRTSWLYGKNGNNFVKTMIRLGKENGKVSVVTDQIGSPTLTSDLILAIEACFESSIFGVYHFSNAGACSWNEFAKAIFKAKKMAVDVLPTTSDAFVRPAKRPAYSVMNTNLIKSALGVKPRAWQEALEDAVLSNPEAF